MTGFLDETFAVTASGSTVATELRGGLTTFATMAYIVVVNASMLSQAVLTGWLSRSRTRPAGPTELAAALRRPCRGLPWPGGTGRRRL